MGVSEEDEANVAMCRYGVPEKVIDFVAGFLED